MISFFTGLVIGFFLAKRVWVIDMDKIRKFFKIDVDL